MTPTANDYKKAAIFELKRRAARAGFAPFVLFTTPGYKMGWVHREICETLEQFLQDVRDKKSPRLMISMPPRSGKRNDGHGHSTQDTSVLGVSCYLHFWHWHRCRSLAFVTVGGVVINALSNLLPHSMDRVMMTLGGVVGAMFSFAFGDIGPLLIWLAVFVVLDYITGILSALRNNKWSSRALFYGTIRKVTIFAMVALAHGLDVALHNIIHIDFVQSIVLVAYIAGEFGSIIENLEKCGLGHVVPPVFKHILDAINLYLDKQVDKHLPPEAKK